MNNEELKTYLLEQNICVLWAFTTTENGCLAFVDALHDMQECYPQGSDSYNLVNDARDLAFAKGNLFALRRQQSYQIKEAAEAFVGDL